MKSDHLFPSGLTPPCLLRKWALSDSTPHSRTKVLQVEHAPASPEGLAQGLLGPMPAMQISGIEVGPENLHF